MIYMLPLPLLDLNCYQFMGYSQHMPLKTSVFFCFLFFFFNKKEGEIDDDDK